MCHSDALPLQCNKHKKYLNPEEKGQEAKHFNVPSFLPGLFIKNERR